MSSKVMATSVMAPSSLPSKKRKASHGSHTSSSIQEESAASTTATTNDNVRIRKDSSSSEQADNNNSNSNNPNSYASKIADSRLPSKKRKGSHDSQQQQTTKRKGSHDQSVSFEDDSPRKSSVDSSTTSMQLLEALPTRKLSHDTANSSSVIKVTPDDNLLPQPAPDTKTTTTTAAAAAAASATEATVYAPANDNEATVAAAAAQPSALEHLDALADDNDDPNDHNSSNDNNDDAKPAARRKTSDATAENRSKSSGDTTFASSGQRLFFEAIMISNAEDAAATQQQGHQHGRFSRERLESWGGFRSSATAARGAADGDFHQSSIINNPTSAGRPRFDSWGGLRGGRDRLESWGAMSDLSIPLGPPQQQQQQQQQQHHHHHSHQAHGGDEHAAAQAAADGSASMEDSKSSAVPSRISLEVGRFNSIGNLSEASASNLPLVLDGVDATGDMQAYVAAAMATVGDQLAEIAGAVETVASMADSATLEAIRKEIGVESDGDSGISPLIGAVSDAKGNKGRPRSWSTSSGKISVDYDAVQAAVDAADAATGALGLAKIGQAAGSSATGAAASGTQVLRKRRSLPTKQGRTRSYSSDDVASGMSGEEKERIRERARVAAGYVPTNAGTSSDDLPSTKKRLPPIKKRAKRNSPESERVDQNAKELPKVTKTKDNRKAPPPKPDVAASSTAPSTQSSSKSRGQASQKWEGMFECLLEFVEERRKEDTEGLSKEEKKDWVWDGNVPTNYKTSCGKALGRWVNNQRSAKSKGTLKEDREERLVAAGLKWSVLASNSWNGMLEELRIYVKEQTRDGRKWDGNVPTCYQIKRDSGKFAGEDKNLGRWVNRQRSLFQAGKLRKERQLALEAVGLKWSMLATLSWESMYETLEAYVETQKKDKDEWDGNVPANYRTNDNPPRALGRWINRQRSAYTKNKLKKEYVDKLNKIGLKWSVHQRQGDSEEMGQSSDNLNGTSGETKSETKSADGEERDVL